jgi:paraquat-inducible protein A
MHAPHDDLIACPACDALYRVADLPRGQRAVCHRCHRVLIAPRAKAGMRIIALALTGVILVAAAMVFPFIRISAVGLSNGATLIDAALAFDGPLVGLSLTVLALIVLLPLTRLLLTLYVLVPLVADRPPARWARRAFRLSEALRPWSMAEIFAIGTAVALVKVADLARVEFGPAFWMFLVLVVVGVLQDRYTCRWSIWHALEHPKT